jgi:hypothetical protein
MAKYQRKQFKDLSMFDLMYLVNGYTGEIRTGRFIRRIPLIRTTDELLTFEDDKTRFEQLVYFGKNEWDKVSRKCLISNTYMTPSRAEANDISNQIFLEKKKKELLLKR